jgi:hypothetical protein
MFVCKKQTSTEQSLHRLPAMEDEELIDALVRLCQVSARGERLYITERDKEAFPRLAELLKTRRVELGKVARKMVQAATSRQEENHRETLSHRGGEEGGR